MNQTRVYMIQFLRPLILFQLLGLLVITLASAHVASEGIEIALASLVVVLPAYFGFICGLARAQVLFGPFSWTLPMVWRRLTWPLFVATGLITLLVNWIYFANGGMNGWLPTSAQAIFWFSLGVMSINATPKRGQGILVGALFLAALASAELLSDFVYRWPITATVLFATGAALILRSGLSAGRLRAAIVTPNFAANKYIRPGTNQVDWRPEQLVQTSHRRRRFQLGSSRRTGAWTRAALHENFGWSWGGLAGKCLLGALPAVAWLIAMQFTPFLLGVSEEPSPFVGSVRNLYCIILDPDLLRDIAAKEMPRPWLVAMFIGAWTCLFLSLTRSSLHLTIAYPLSRRDRASVTYRSALLHSMTTLAAMAVLLLVVGEVAMRVAGYSDHPPVPGFLRPLLLAAIGAPLVQWLTLRYATLQQLKMNQAALVVGLVLMTAGFSIALPIAETLWRNVSVAIPLLSQFAIVIGLVAMSQCLFAWRLRRHFLKADLV